MDDFFQMRQRESKDSTMNEALRWLRREREPRSNRQSILELWKGLESTFPTVAAMARDIFAIPGK